MGHSYAPIGYARWVKGIMGRKSRCSLRKNSVGGGLYVALPQWTDACVFRLTSSLRVTNATNGKLQDLFTSI